MDVRAIQAALSLGGDTHTLDDVLDQIERGEAQLWTDGDSTIVTEIHQTPRKRVLHFWLAAGDLDSVVRLSGKALEWGREQGCTMATLAGRRGWEQVLTNWSPMLTLMSREL